MARHIFRFRCPCCSKKIEFDTRSGKAQAQDPMDAHSGKDLMDLLDSQAKEGERLDGLFGGAAEDERGNLDRLDRLFDEAQEDAKGDTSKPSNPFDLE